MLLTIISLILVFILIGSFLFEDLDSNSGTLNTISLVVFFAVIYFVQKDFYSFLIGLVTTNILKTILAVFLYFVLGGIWSVIRWFIFVVDFKRKELEYKERNSYTNYTLSKPSAATYKGKIISWISYFPASIVAVVLRELLGKFVVRIFNYLSATYDKITDKIYS